MLFYTFINSHSQVSDPGVSCFKKFFQECYQNVKQFGSRSGPTSCPNCLQRLSADGKSWFDTSIEKVRGASKQFFSLFSAKHVSHQPNIR